MINATERDLVTIKNALSFHHFGDTAAHPPFETFPVKLSATAEKKRAADCLQKVAQAGLDIGKRLEEVSRTLADVQDTERVD
jgi:hypothetical protein